MQLPLMHPNSAAADSFGWIRNNSSIEGKGLSLSLSNSTNMESFGGCSSNSLMNFFGYNSGNNNGNKNVLENSMGITAGQVLHLGLPHPAASNSRMMNLLRNSLYLKAAQELLEEFCCVGRGYFKNVPSSSSKVQIKLTKGNNPNCNKSVSTLNAAGGGGGGGGPVTSSTGGSKERQPLSASERAEYQRRKAKLLFMLDEASFSLSLSSLSLIFFHVSEIVSF